MHSRNKKQTNLQKYKLQHTAQYQAAEKELSYICLIVLFVTVTKKCQFKSSIQLIEYYLKGLDKRSVDGPEFFVSI